MTRDEAYRLASSIAGAGCPAFAAFEPSGFCSVHSSSRRFTAPQLARLAEIAAEQGVELWLDGTVQFQQTTRGM